MPKLLYVNGCSMTFGDELGPPGDPICNIRAWPRYLGEMLDATVVNDARPGGSNDRIVRRTIGFIGQFLTDHSPDELRVVIAWSSPIRREFHEVEIDNWYNFVPSDMQSAGTLTPVYCPAFCSEEESMGRYYAQLLPMQAFLKQHNIAYAFFTGLWYPYTFDSTFRNMIDTTRYFMLDDSFHHWAHMNDYPIGPGKHPLEAAHRDWARLLYEAMWR